MSARDRLTDQITIRLAYADDERALLRLAALDSAPAPPAPPLLVAEVDGKLRAALSLSERGSSIADPFYPSAPLVRLLGAHAREADRTPRRGARRLRRRRPLRARAAI
ncbi:MAG TPA: hypothetical protein VFW09_14305 [Solirubrobacteraceae bacterium]|jgi:hypothetical protein|nr:hypothetical protein [Solirubrobacteraceae bacterium]